MIQAFSFKFLLNLEFLGVEGGIGYSKVTAGVQFCHRLSDFSPFLPRDLGFRVEFDFTLVLGPIGTTVVGGELRRRWW